MFDLFLKTSAPAYRQIGLERSAECALIHAQSFACAWQEDDFEQLFAGPEVVADGAIETCDGRLAGFVLSRTAADEAEILTIAVSAARRRRGVGRTLMAVHRASLSARGVGRLFLEVDTGNAAARALYASCGFHQVAERKAYYRLAGAATRASALVMRLDLHS